MSALQASIMGTRVRITYLRLDAQGRFTPGMTVIAGGPSGAGFMPI